MGENGKSISKLQKFDGGGGLIQEEKHTQNILAKIVNLIIMFSDSASSEKIKLFCKHAINKYIFIFHRKK